MQNNPLISIIMPTYNSEWTILMALEWIKKQTYKNYEILVIDGWSNDKTKDIAQQYWCKIIDNPKKQQEYAKHIWLLQAKWEYIMFLDSDEVLDSIDSVEARSYSMENWNLDVLLFWWYQNPQWYSDINEYINAFADPFAWWMYGIGWWKEFWLSDLKKKYNLVDRWKYFDISFGGKDLPLVDFCASNMLRKSFVYKKLSNLDDPMIIPSLFYQMVALWANVGIMNSKYTITHYSADSMWKYINKLIRRVKANINHKDIPGTGFANRVSYQSKWLSFKKFLFPIYSISIILPALDSIKRWYLGHNNIYFMHTYLCLVVTYYIILEYTKKILKINSWLHTYGK